MDYLDGITLGLLLIFIPIIILAIVISVVEIIGRWKLFKKAGKNGWEAIIPFYSDWVYVEIAGLNWWYFLIVCANSLTIVVDDVQIFARPVAIIGLFFCNYNISKKLHKDTGFAVLMTLFPFVMLPLIGFSNSYEWDNNVSVGVNGPINSNNSNNGSSNASYIADDNNQYTNEMNNTQNWNVKYCSYCGNRINSDSKFCGNCGREI